jgi:hypothetical protein
MGVVNPQETQQQYDHDFHESDTFAKRCIKIGSVIRLYPLTQISERDLQRFYKLELFKLPPSIPESESVIPPRTNLAEKYALKYKENGKYAPASGFQKFDLRELTEKRGITVPNYNSGGRSMNPTLYPPPLTLTPMQSGLNIKHKISQLFILTSICSYIIFTEGNKKTSIQTNKFVQIQGLDYRREG